MKLNERIALALCICFIAVPVLLAVSQEVPGQLIAIHNLSGGERFMAALGLWVSAFTAASMSGFIAFSIWLVFCGKDWGSDD